MVEIIRWTCFVMVIGLAVVIGSIISASAEDRVILSIKSPSDGETVHSNKITVSGTATAKGVQYIKSVTVNGNPADGKDKWSADILLKEGNNSIEVVATTDTGQYNSTTITVNYQPTPPPTQPPSYDGAPSEIPAPTPTPTGSISIISIPSDAKVYLKDFFRGTTPTLVNVTEGYYEIEVIKEGYEIHSETKIIRFDRGEPEEWIIKLKPLTRPIHILSTPSGASVHLDNVYKKDTNCTLSEVVVGPHTITLKKSGYFDETRNVSVSVRRTTCLYVNLTPCPRCGYINISSNPPGANVYLDGNYMGKTPKNISKVAQGNHTIKLTKFGYFDVIIKNVSVSVGEVRHLRENLTGYGSLSISSKPSGAKVYLDGNYTGETPLNIEEVVVGSYSYRLTKTYRKDVADEIHVSAGKLTKIDKSLSFKDWVQWLPKFLAGLGAFVGGISAFFRWVINPRRSKEKDLLFRLDSSYRQHLKQGDVDENLKNVFEDKEEFLSSEAKVFKIAKKQWEIVDGNMEYRIEDTKKRLYIYKKRNN